MSTNWIPLLVPSDRYTDYAAMVVADATELGLLQESKGQQTVTTPTGESDLPAGLRSQPSAGQPSEKERAAERLAQQLPYSEDDLARIAEGKYLTTARWTRAMDFCAQHPGEFFTTTEVCEHTGLTLNEWRDAPRKLPQHLDRHYPDVPTHTTGEYAGTHVWPLLAWSFRGDGEVSWAMNEEQSLRWRRVRKETWDVTRSETGA